MKVVDPIGVTPSILLASSLSASDGEPAEWSVGTTYSQGVAVRFGARVYESLISGNVGFTPATTPTAWRNVRPTNRWAMFDDVMGTRSVAADVIDITLAPGRADLLAVLDTTAAAGRVTVHVDGVKLYDRTRTTTVSGGLIDDWEDYFLTDIGQTDMLIFADLPAYSQAEIRLMLTGSGTIAAGTVLVGRDYDLGLTEAGASIGITDFSRKMTDDFGVTSVVERAWSKRMTARAMVPTIAVGSIQRRLAGLRAKPALWIGEDGDIGLTIYGFFKDFSIDLALPMISYLSLTVEGII